MTVGPIPIQRYLVDSAPPSAPEGTTRIDETITGSLPHTIDLGNGVVLVLVVANGLAVTWRDANPSAIVSSSDLQLTASAPPADPEIIGDVSRAAAHSRIETCSSPSNMRVRSVSA